LIRLIILYPLSFFTGSGPGADFSPLNDNVLLLYSQVPWWGVWQRPQEEAMGFARRHRVLFVSPVQVHEILFRYKRWKILEKIDEGKGISVFSPLIFSGHYKFPWIFYINRILLKAELHWHLRNEKSIIFMTNSPFVDNLLSGLRISTLIYDVIDDFAAFEWAPSGSFEMEKNILKSADIVFTGTRTLCEDKKSYFKDAEFIPCGVNFERFYLEKGETPKIPDDIRDLPRPLIGYTGTLSERIDCSIISGIAKRLPDVSIVLIGPVHRKIESLPDAPNIHYLGLKKHEELASYLHNCQVALLPFRMTKAAMAINPVKTLEYLAAGCLVVSTAIPDVVRFYSDVVYIENSPEEFIDRTVSLLESSNDLRIEAGIELARSSTWEAMVQRMEQKIIDHAGWHSAEEV
jgi:glycosyltransferase involved in cell wall biosynthesis